MDSLAIFLLWLAPGAYVATGLMAPLAHTERAWRAAEIVAAALMGTSLVASLDGLRRALDGATVDGAGLAMATLVSVLGWIIVRFSRRYLEGEPNQASYIASLMGTLAAVMAVTITQHLGLLLAAWIASSLTLHGLLTFYSDRPAALASAHKKFLASRLSDLCLIAALALIYWATGSLELSTLNAHAQVADTLDPALHAALVLIAITALLKSAQLPVHGWILQVMEAPTPVSALMHAGVVNLSGFVLIRLAEPLAAAPLARWVLVIAGGLTAALATLVMMTRVSIKVRLAWSTCSQMGFMLVECGLGLYELALLHLIAHSTYKAHAFLNTGETVAMARHNDLLAWQQTTPWRLRFAAQVLAAPAAIGLLAAVAWAWQPVLTAHVPTVALIIVGIGLAPLLWPAAEPLRTSLPRGALIVVGLAHLYLLWHIAFASLVPVYNAPASAPLICLAVAVFIGLYGAQFLAVSAPETRASQALRRWAVAGFFLDELFTRLTFRIWPLRLPPNVRASPATAPTVLPGEPS